MNPLNARPWLPKTGQTVPSRAGDDATFQAGRPGTTRFVVGDNGLTFDRHAGLSWVSRPELIIPGAVGVHVSNQIQVARGDWANVTVYAKADLAKDTVGVSYWVCAVAHTSDAGPTTFAQDRAANPTYWRETVWTASAANLTTPAEMVWNDAVDNCLALVYAGFSDWRMPNLFEMVALYDGGGGAPSVDATWTNFQFAYYWSSTHRKNSETRAHGVNFGTGGALGVSAALKTATFYARPVRGGRTILG